MRCLTLVLFALLLAPPARGGTLTVTNLNDAFAGSLRQAISDAAPGDTIGFAAGLTGTIPVTSAYLQVLKPLTILGPGAGILALSGNDTGRILSVFNGEVRISGLTFRNGNGSDGAAIYNADTLKVTRCTFSNNRATNAGGGINSASVLEVTECTFDNNRCDSGGGAAIRCNNTATITGSTFRANVGTAVLSQKYLLLINSTFNGNSGSTGGALALLGSPVAMISCTIVGNSSSSTAGGVYMSGANPPNVRSNIIAGNTATVSGPDVTGTFYSEGYNLVGNGSNSTGFGISGSHDLVGSTGAPINPNVAALGDYGGPTWTMPPLPGSPAIDQGWSGYVTDQRGHPRAYDQATVSNAGGGDASDIGAYELGPTVRLVTTLADAGVGSLRKAVTDMHPLDADTVKFAANLKGTITLTSGVITIGNTGVIKGPNPWQITVSGNDAGRVFIVSPGKKAEISDLTITGGKENEGIALLGFGDLTMRRCRVVGNNAVTGDIVLGGVVRMYPPAKLLMEDCTVANNAPAFGGCVFIGSGTNPPNEASFTNCTFSTNAGPAIVSSTGTVTVRNCTITNNTVGAGGHALWSLQGPAISVGSTIVAGNSGGTSPDVSGAFTTAGWNLIGKSDGSTGFTNGLNGDQVGTAAAPLPAGLGPLQANGGPGETHALLPGSLAIDKGRVFRLFDQRGAARYDDPAVVNADDGSDIGSFERNPTSPIGVDPLPLATALVLQAARPNPAPGGATVFVSRLGTTTSVNLDLYDVSGRLVRHLVRGSRPAGEYADRWDGRDEEGRRAPAGVYFARLAAAGRQESRSFVVLP